ncbi:hypothetical protein DFH29DRAFT_424331 [Suillus ampliporus]|nr:hypothetical protein DFH29DRAFT_424331 [Suillus ampliporus]
MAVEQRREQESELANAYDIKAVGLKDLCITTADDLTETSLSRSARPKYLLVHPWSRDLLDPLAEDSESEYGSPTETLDGNPIDYYAETDHRSASRLLVRLGQPFSAMLLMRLQGAEYKRIACDRQIIAQVDDDCRYVGMHAMYNSRTRKQTDAEWGNLKIAFRRMSCMLSDPINCVGIF